jgi:hypothetical protein
MSTHRGVKDRRDPGPLRCRGCGAQAGALDLVATEAVEYTCSRCLLQGRPAAKSGGSAISLQAPSFGPCESDQESPPSGTAKAGQPDFSKYRRRGGRQRLGDVERRRRQRDRKRRYRAKAVRRSVA